MPGKIKYKPVRPRVPPSHRSHMVRMAQQTAAPANVDAVFNTSNNVASPKIGTASIIWLTALSVMVLVALGIIAWLLFRCRRGKERKRHSNGHWHHPSLEVRDGRNEFPAWNRNAMSAAALVERPAAVATTTTARYVYTAEPVVVDEAPPLVRDRGSRRSRYYNRASFGAVWNRISQIGRAY